MTRILRYVALPVAALVSVLSSFTGAADASLVNDSVTCTETIGGVDACSTAAATVTDPGIPEFTLNLFFGQPDFTVDLKASSITLAIIDVPTTVSIIFPAGQTLILGDLDSSAGDIVGRSLSTSGGLSGLTLSDISFTAHSVVIDLGGTGWADTPTPGTAVISLIFENSAAVPVPGPFVLLIAAVAGMGVVRAWRRR
jgi:hypothetical protein